MQSHNVQPIHKNKPTMIVGRGGHRGKTSGRGGKGQTARAGNKRRPEIRDFIKRIPKLRGRGKSSFKSFAIRPWAVSITAINKVFKDGDTVTPKTLLEKGLVKTVGGKIPVVKILQGKISTNAGARGHVGAALPKKLIISDCFVSVGLKTSIEKAGGSVSGSSVANAKDSVPKSSAPKK
jgi:large subunit ribosomal protein L15